MNDWIKWLAPYLGSVLRKVMVGFGVWLVSHGIDVTSDPDWAVLLNSLDALAGILLAVGAALWSLWNKKRADKRVL